MRRREVQREFADRATFTRRSFLLLPGVGQRPSYDEYVIEHRRAAAQREPELGFAIPDLGQPYPQSSMPAQRVALRVQATQPDRLEALEEAFYHAVFRKLHDLADGDVLRSCARQAGVAESEVEHALADESLETQALEEHRDALSRGIMGVPAVWTPDGGPLVGAVPTDLYRQALQRATMPAD